MNAPALEERIHVHNVKKKSKETRRKQAELSSEPKGLMIIRGSTNIVINTISRFRKEIK